MACISYPKWKSYVLTSPDRPHIFRSPPSSIMTRKKEYVNLSDVTYNIRNDDSRINEAINYIARGSNPHVDTSYSNYGGNGATTLYLPHIASKNPYGVMRDGAFRPPMYTQEDLLPLSRMRRPETCAITNSGIPIGYNNQNLPDKYDVAPVKMSIDKEKINYFPVQPTASIKLETPQEIYTDNAINEYPLLLSAGSNPSYQDFELEKNVSLSGEIMDRELVSAGSNVNSLSDIERNEDIDMENYIKNNPILKNISPNVGVVIYDNNNQNYIEVEGSIKDKINIAVQSSLGRPIDLTQKNGIKYKLKDYLWKIVKTNVGSDMIVIKPSINSDLNLDRNLPVYSYSSNVSGHTKNTIYNTDVITKNNENISVSSPITVRDGRAEVTKNYPTEMYLRRPSNFGPFEDRVSKPVMESHPIPTFNFKKIAAY
jgi:hypothetical protein